ncbi:phosphate ABC transporter substrate-binding protein PstS family protein [Aliivibrio sp. S4TY2]|uniref:PstS family phosphate ABC transporter substrate-binding protein n=1 Tax=unclassified Aliivibrio TaxID=2645654 RepID=UPI002378BEF3|nr:MULTISPECIES: phosphate ABC transporter substrate-binding protein PstS family protein [unclassified Aliivibrio]MDD9154918.1 phosphate ABC transporter substrate-binding protein PstS family protein [Aliivibrio sp. S4TY2]MDD9158719.1 phosphate ABC transporter substrate-binding protein PstS family protein [Aliivibrio sp. S4TY1]MDD9162921.1 phosphate ABC transporter substrate-binding protein PstS family protein [Aliivibrio sp. S4MY2]MDD9166718.1 phosphate ABC transporter substrate-binding protein
MKKTHYKQQRWFRALIPVGLLWLGFISNAFSYDGKLAPYERVAGISGNLSSIGSDTLANMMTLWAEDFQRIYPNVNIQIQASGSSTAPPALIESTAQFGPMSRRMRQSEKAAFERQFGYPPTEIRVAIDALGIFVHQDNPIKGLNFSQLDAIFSATLRCGSVKPINRWQDLGVNSSWSKHRIQLFGRNSVSGTYGYFKKNALCNGDFKVNVNEQPGSASVVQGVSASLNGIGYSGVGYHMSGVKLLPITREGTNYIEPSTDNIISGQYPLARFLYIYINKSPTAKLQPLETEFIRYMLSLEGQKRVEQDGYIALSERFVLQELSKLDLH